MAGIEHHSRIGDSRREPYAEAPEIDSQEDWKPTETEVGSVIAVRTTAPPSAREFRNHRPIAMLVTLSAAGLALATLVFSIVGIPNRDRMHTFFGRAQQKADPGAAPAVSEAEKAAVPLLLPEGPIRMEPEDAREPKSRLGPIYTGDRSRSRQCTSLRGTRRYL